MKNKEELLELIEELEGHRFLTMDEASAYASALRELDSEEGLEFIEEEASSTALRRGALDRDVEIVAEYIMTVAKNKPVVLQKLDKLPKPKNFKFLKVDLYKIKRPADLHHPIITLEYKDETYTFGFNVYNTAVSYSENGGPVKWVNIPKEILKEDDFRMVEDLKVIIASIMDIDI